MSYPPSRAGSSDLQGPEHRQLDDVTCPIPRHAQVALIYKDPSIGNSMTVSVVKILTLTDDLLEDEILEDGDKGSGKSASAMLHK